MSSGGKKTIQINQDFFSLSGGKSRKKRGKKNSSRKKREKPTDHSKTSKKMRKEFFSKIRALQEKKRKENTSISSKKEGENDKDKSGFNKAFDESLSFLSKYVQDKEVKKKKKKRKTLKKKEKQLEISLEMPDNLNKPINDENTNSNDSKSVSSPLQVITDTPNLKVSIAKRPPYSSMKGGTRPTYREYIRQQTLKKDRNKHHKSHITIENKPDIIDNERSKKLEQIKARFKSNKDPEKKKGGKRMMKIKKCTRTIKRKLGKIDGTRKVAVLIKSRESRKGVQTEKVKLGQVSIIDIKKYLKDKNLIKAGSKSPNDVLRKMYEQAILAGDITNKSDGILLHNYISEQ